MRTLHILCNPYHHAVYFSTPEIWTHRLILTQDQLQCSTSTFTIERIRHDKCMHMVTLGHQGYVCALLQYQVETLCIALH